MAALLFWSVSAIILTIFWPQLTCSCSCSLAHPQTTYCNAKYVIIIKPKELVVSNDGYKLTYRARLSRVFKDTLGLFKVKSNILIQTSPHDAMCGISLDLDEKYIITGNIVMDGSPFVTLCDIHIPWKALHKKQKKGFERLYQDGCQCGIERITYFSAPTNSSAVCNWHTFHPHSECQEQHSVCMMHQNNKCEWLRSRDFKGCLRKKDAETEKKWLMEP